MNKILMLIIIISMILLVGCNTNGFDWDKKQCHDLGLEYYKSSAFDRIYCEDIKTGEVRAFSSQSLEYPDKRCS